MTIQLNCEKVKSINGCEMAITWVSAREWKLYYNGAKMKEQMKVAIEVKTIHK